MEKKAPSTSINTPKKLSIGIRILHSFFALILGGSLALAFTRMARSGVFTADLMNQYGEVVNSLSGSEMLYDISTGGDIKLYTTREYRAISGMRMKIYYNQDKITIDETTINSNLGEIEVTTNPYTIIADVSIASGKLAKDIEVFSFGYTGENARWVQKNTVFIAKALIETTQEDLIVFTNTPKDPNPDVQYRE